MHHSNLLKTSAWLFFLFGCCCCLDPSWLSSSATRSGVQAFDGSFFIGRFFPHFVFVVSSLHKQYVAFSPHWLQNDAMMLCDANFDSFIRFDGCARAREREKDSSLISSVFCAFRMQLEI